MKFASAVLDAYKRKWSYINTFTVSINFAEGIAKKIGWSVSDAEASNLNIKDISTPQFTNSPIEAFIGDQWKFHNGRDEIYTFSITFRDQDQMKLYRKFLLAYFCQRTMYFDDAKMTIKLIKDADYTKESELELFEFSDVLINSVSQVQFSNETEAQIAEFSVDFKCKVPNLKAKIFK